MIGLASREGEGGCVCVCVRERGRGEGGERAGRERRRDAGRSCLFRSARTQLRRRRSADSPIFSLLSFLSLFLFLFFFNVSIALGRVSVRNFVRTDCNATRIKTMRGQLTSKRGSHAKYFPIIRILG
jgi:hypothetical protein